MIKTLKALLRALATADAIIQPEWEYRYFSYDNKWGEGEEVASMRDGEGGHWFVHFHENRVGYLYISPEDGCLENRFDFGSKIPEGYKEFLKEPAFNSDQATGIWLLTEEEKWLTLGKQRAEHLIDLPTVIGWEIKGYQAWAEEYYETKLDSEAIEKVFSLEINEGLAKQLNPKIQIDDLLNDLEQIGIDLKFF